MLIGLYVIERTFISIVDTLQLAILETCEVELLIREKVQGSCEYSERHWLQVFRALGYYHDVGSCLTFLRFTQTTGWQQLVIDDKAMVIHKKDVDSWFYITVLIGIVKKDDICILCRFIGGYAFNSITSVAVNGNTHVLELAMHLIRLITDIPHRGIIISEDESLGLTLIATRQYCHAIFIMEQADEVFNVWGFARATHGDIADGYDRHIKGTALQDSKIEERVPYSNSQTVKP